MRIGLWTDFYRGGRGAIALIAASLALVACQTSAPAQRTVTPRPTQPSIQTPTPDEAQTPISPEPQRAGPEGLIPPHMEDRSLVRIGLLLPFSAKSTALREEARSMLNAAQMAIFELRDPRLVLIPKDTGGTASGARSAANAVIKDGAALILGPVLGKSVSAAARPAARADIPMIAFSTDRSVAGNGVYLLSFLPEADIERMLGYLHARNAAAFENFTALRSSADSPALDDSIHALALLRPDNRYGDRIENALFSQTTNTGIFLTDIARYSRNAESMSAPARQIAHVDERNTAITVWEDAGGFGDPGLDPAFDFSLPYQAIFIPENGVRLRSLAPLLPFYDVDPKITHFIGTSLWNDEDLLHEPALFRGWFPAPNAQDRSRFTQGYETRFAQKPSRLASLAHDGVLLIPQTLFQGRTGLAIGREALESLEGFRGADGLFRFGHDGLAQRLLSVFEIRQGEFREIDPAPERFEDISDGVDSAAY